MRDVPDFHSAGHIYCIISNNLYIISILAVQNYWCIQTIEYSRKREVYKLAINLFTYLTLLEADTIGCIQDGQQAYFTCSYATGHVLLN